MHHIIIFIIILCFSGFPSYAAEEALLDHSKTLHVRYDSKLNLTMIKLKNGMTVYLKPTDFEMDEVIIKVTALGGYASLEPESYASGQLASQIAWESGMDSMSSDKVSVLLYENCLEFYPKIQAFSRSIEGSAHRDGLESFLNCINMLFTKSKFTKEGYQTAMAQARASAAKHRFDFEQTYEDAFLSTNTQNFEALGSLKSEDLLNVRFDEARRFFYQAFSNPQDFICVMVGNFDLEQVKPLLERYLETIPAANEPFPLKTIALPRFPQGITHKVIPVSAKKDSLTRLTLPLSMSLKVDNIHLFEFTCQVIEARLRRIITEQMKTSHGIDVAYEFPVYPRLDSPWMTIQFRSEAKLVNPLIRIILAEMQSMQNKGVTQKEVDEIKKFEQGSDELWLHDNYYWVAVLSNYYLWGWNPEGIQKKHEQLKELDANTLNQILKSYFSLKNYSIVTAQ